MSVWDLYQQRTNVRGDTKRMTQYNREVRTLRNKLPDNLSYQTVDIYDITHGYNICDREPLQQELAIINSDNLNEKMIYSMPEQDIVHGGLVHWMDNYWLITERDANTNIYARAKMIQCNHLLRWVSDEDEIIEQWCIVEDGTKYLTGEYEDRHFVVTRGDSRIYLTIARNDETKKLNRENRFLIDDPDSPIQIAYALTKPLKLGGTYNGSGVFKFVLQEVQTTDNDNIERRIADYYKHFNREEDYPTNEPKPDIGGKKVWL